MYKREAQNLNPIQIEFLEEIPIILKTSGFENILIEAIDETFSKLGTAVNKAFYSFLEVNYKLTKENIPSRIGDFVDGLQRIFRTGAPLLEIDIIKNLQQKTPSFIYLLESPDLSFEDYLQSLNRYLENL